MGSPILIYEPGGGVPITVPVPEPPAGRVAGEHGITLLTEDQEYVDVVFVTTQPRSDWTFLGLEVVNTGSDVVPLNIWPGTVTSKTRAGFRLYLNGLPNSGEYYVDWTIGGATESEGGTATEYMLSGPTSGVIGVATAFVVALPEGTSLETPVTITPDDAGSGGLFVPTTVELSTDMPSANFTYMPGAYGDREISTTNDGFLTDPSSITFTPVSGSYLMDGPSIGTVGVASTDFTVELPGGGVVLSTVTVTPADAGDGGVFTPSTVSLTTAAPSATFTYTPASAGAKTISVTNNRGLTDPGNLTYTATAPALADGDPVSSWADSSGAGHTATMTGSNRPTFKTNILNGKPVVRFTAAGASGLNLASSIPGGTPYTMFAVMKPTGNTVTLWTLTPGEGAGTVDGSAPFGVVELNGAPYLSNRVYFNNVTVDISGAFHVLTASNDGGAGFTILTDGTAQSVTGGALPNATTSNFGRIGQRIETGNGYSDGDIAEIIFYNVVLSSTDRANIEKYLGTKYGITVAGGGSAVDPSTVSGLVGWWKADSL